MGVRGILLGAVLALTGCEERMFGFAGYWLPATLPAGGSAAFLVSVDATPAAWPPHVEGRAVRLAFVEQDGGASSTAVDITVLGRRSAEVDHGVTVLDLLEDCNPRQTCRDTFQVDLRCTATEACVGEFGGDAYVSTRQPGREAPADALLMTIEPLVVQPEPTLTTYSTPTP